MKRLVWLLLLFACAPPTEPKPEKHCEFVVRLDSLPDTLAVTDSCGHYVVPWPFP